MTECLSNSFERSADHTFPYKGYRKVIYDGLSLGDVEFIDANDDMVRIIASNLEDLSLYLQIPLPKIGLTRHWNENTPDDLGSFSVKDVLANSLVDSKFPSGIIRFSPLYLEEYASHRLSLTRVVGEQDKKLPLPLSALCGHEAFHLWQFRNNQEQMQKDLLKLENKGLRSWSHTVSEVQATVFEAEWIEQRFEKLRQIQQANLALKLSF